MLALPHLSAAECAAALRRLGFRTRRERRSRLTLRRAGVSVVVPQAGTLGPALVASIVRQAGVEPLEFLRALEGPGEPAAPAARAEAAGPTPETWEPASGPRVRESSPSVA